MPVCPACSMPRHALLSFHRSAAKYSVSSHARAFSRSDALTLLHKTTALLPRALRVPHTPSAKINAYPDQSLQLWDHILSDTYHSLHLGSSDSPARIVVYGIDKWAGARELVTALLEEPLSSDELQASLLHDRWKDATRTKLTISHQRSIDKEKSEVQLSSPYLAKFSVPIQITEISPSSSTSRSPSLITEETTRALFQADIPVVVCNPLTVPLLPLTCLPGNTIIILTGTPSQLAPDDLLARFPRDRDSESNLDAYTVLFVDPARATNAIRILKSDPSSPSAIQRYQDEYVGSGILSVTTALEKSLGSASASQNGLSASIAIRERTAFSQISDALRACSTSLRHLKNELDGVYTGVSKLNGRIEESRARVHMDVLDEASAGKKPDGDRVVQAVHLAEKEMRAVMEQLTWWRMVMRVDEISGVVSAAVERAWCPGLEKQLILETGKLSTLQRELTACAFALLSSAPSSFNTALLENTLLQLKSSPSYTLTPQTLTRALYTRKSQIIAYPTTRLHVAGQKAVLGISGGVAAGVGITWSGWLGWLVGSGEGLLGFVGMEPATAVGVGVLGAVASIRWAISKWEKAKRRWWEDWARVGDGLDRDLRATLDEVMTEKVAIVAEVACARLTEQSDKINDEIEAAQNEVQKLKTSQATIKEHASESG